MTGNCDLKLDRARVALMGHAWWTRCVTESVRLSYCIFSSPSHGSEELVCSTSNFDFKTLGKRIPFSLIALSWRVTASSRCLRLRQTTVFTSSNCARWYTRRAPRLPEPPVTRTTLSSSVGIGALSSAVGAEMLVMNSSSNSSTACFRASSMAQDLSSRPSFVLLILFFQSLVLLTYGCGSVSSTG